MGDGYNGTMYWKSTNYLLLVDNAAPFKLNERSPNFLLINGQITRHMGKETSMYLGVENATNFRQSNPILSADAPHETYFR